MDYFKLTQQEIEEFTVTNSEYYVAKWQKYPENSLFAGWNWAAFFVPPYWAAFRKMYALIGIIVLYQAFLGVLFLGILSLDASEDMIMSYPILLIPTFLLVNAQCLFLGLLGTGLYRRKAMKAVSLTTGMDENEKKEYLNKAGNISNKAVMITLAAMASYAILTYYVAYTDAFGSGTVIVSDCDRFTAEIPAGWIELKDYELNDQADLQAFHRRNEAFFILLTDVKEDIDYDFNEWKDLLISWLVSSNPDIVVGESFDVVISDRPAHWLALTEYVDDDDNIYLLTFIDGENHFGQIFCWSPAQYYHRYENKFVDIIFSIEGL